MNADPNTYSVREVATITGWSLATTYRMVASGEIPIIPTQRRVKRVPKVWVDELLAKPVREWQEAS